MAMNYRTFSMRMKRAFFTSSFQIKRYASRMSHATVENIARTRVTVLVGANADGSEKLPLLVIGKSKKPRCFKNVNSLPVVYDASKKAWMNSTIFTSWLRQLDKRFARQQRNVLLLLDNCPAQTKRVIHQYKIDKKSKRIIHQYKIDK